VTKRRGSGEGSIFHEKAKGLWCAQVYLMTPSGRRKAVRRRAKTKAEAKDLLIQLQHHSYSGRLNIADARTGTLSEHLQWWLEAILPNRLGVRPSTRDQYRWALFAYVVPVIGDVRMSQLTPQHIERVVGGMNRRGLSASTIAKARVPLSMALEQAVRDGVLLANPVKSAALPQSKKSSKRDALNRAQLDQLMRAARGKRIEPLVRLAFMTGLRRGELLALRWQDVDFDSEILHVRGTLKRQAGGGFYLDDPKTEKGRRSIPLQPSAVSTLRRWRDTQLLEKETAGDRWQDHGFVFTSNVGTPLDPSNLRRQWQAIGEEAGLGRLRFHAARHTFATLALESGKVELAEVSRFLGHGSLAVTADIYSHVLPTSMKDVMGKALSYMGLDGEGEE
jgi:integrase